MDPIDLGHSMANRKQDDGLIHSFSDTAQAEEVISKRRNPFYMRSMKHSYKPKASATQLNIHTMSP